MLIIRPEKSDESPLIDDILQRAYGRESEVLLLASLRGTPDFVPPLSLVADEDGTLRGYALFMKAAVEGRDVHSAASLVLLAVPRENRKQGVGERLISVMGVSAAEVWVGEILFVFGDFGYFSRIGFRLAEDLNLVAETPHPQLPLLALDLGNRLSSSGSGTVRYPHILRPR